jgi:hypothetical protein
LWCAGGLYPFILLFFVVFVNPAIDLLLNESGTHFWYKAFWFVFFWVASFFFGGVFTLSSDGGLLFPPSAALCRWLGGGKDCSTVEKDSPTFLFLRNGFHYAQLLCVDSMSMQWFRVFIQGKLVGSNCRGTNFSEGFEWARVIC